MTRSANALCNVMPLELDIKAPKCVGSHGACLAYIWRSFDSLYQLLVGSIRGFSTSLDVIETKINIEMINAMLLLFVLFQSFFFRIFSLPSQR